MVSLGLAGHSGHAQLCYFAGIDAVGTIRRLDRSADFTAN
jgi:hypothetical protein